MRNRISLFLGRFNFLFEGKLKSRWIISFEEFMYKKMKSKGWSTEKQIKVALILFDEIQDFPEIVTSLKAFCLDKRFDVICSGSMLGINYKKIQSNRVGYKSEYEMQSMDFEEFLWAKGYGKDLIEELLAHMIYGTAFNQTTISTFSSLYLDYCILGGMPAVVRSYIEKGTFEGTLALQKDLLNDY